jgi:hypothetical protein
MALQNLAAFPIRPEDTSYMLSGIIFFLIPFLAQLALHLGLLT